MQTNIAQNVNLYTAHVINILLKNYLQHYFCEHLDESKIYFFLQFKKVLSSSVLNSLAPIIHSHFISKSDLLTNSILEKNILQQYCSSVLLTCLEKTKGGHESVQTMVQKDDKNPCVQSQARCGTKLQFSVQPSGQNENRERDRCAQGQGMGGM